jgi:hypothetical protein
MVLILMQPLVVLKVPCKTEMIRHRHYRANVNWCDKINIIWRQSSSTTSPIHGSGNIATSVNISIDTFTGLCSAQ